MWMVSCPQTHSKNRKERKITANPALDPTLSEAKPLKNFNTYIIKIKLKQYKKIINENEKEHTIAFLFIYDLLISFFILHFFFHSL